MLIAYTSDNSSDLAGTIFWAHDAAEPGAAVPIPGTGLGGGVSSTDSPNAILDPSRSAVVVFGHSGDLVQTTSSDAATVAFPAPTVLDPDGAAPRTGQAPDGRAALAYYAFQTLNPPNSTGATTTVRLFAATRRPGEAFPTPGLIDGSAEIEAGYYASNDVVVAPTGRVAIGYSIRANRGSAPTCQMSLGESRTKVAVGDIPAMGLTSFATSELAGGGTVSSFNPRVAAGPDGRIAVSWVAQQGCGLSTAGFLDGGAFRLADDAAFTALPDAPRSLGALAFRPDGQLVALGGVNGYEDSQLSTMRYDLAPPAATPTPSATVTATPTAGVTVTPTVAPTSEPTPAPVTLAITKVTANRSKGTLAVEVRAPAAGAVTARATAKLKKKTVSVAKRTVTAAAPGSVTITLKPKGKARKALRKAGKLKARLKVSAGSAGPVTRPVAFRYKK